MPDESRKRQEITRRGFLQGVVLSGGAAVAGTALSSGALAQSAPKAGGAPATAPRHKDLIDVHHHYVPPAYLAGVIQAHPKAEVNPPVRLWNTEKTLADMEKSGTATAILSITNPGLWFGQAEESRKLARICNDYAARMMADYPGRFGAFAAAPMLDVEGSLREIEYALDVLKFDGIGVFTDYDGKYLGEAIFRPVLEELNRRKAILYTHPVACPGCVGLVPEVAERVVEFGTDTTRTIASILFSGAAARYPDIRFIFSHAGGTMPFLIDRFEQSAKEPKHAKLLPKGLMYEVQRFYYDTAQTAHPIPISALAKLVPLSQIVFGTDFPYRPGDEQVAALHTCGFSARQMRAIERENALRLLPRLKG